MAKYNCEECAASFSKKSDLMQHRRTTGHNLVCHVCGKTFSRIDNLNSHLKRHVDINQYNCDECGKVFNRLDNLERHKQSQHTQIGGKRPLDDTGPHPKRFKEDDVKSHYQLTKIKETFQRKFNTMGTVYKVTFKDIEVQEVKEVLKTLKNLFTSIIIDITKFAEDQDLIRLSFQTPELDYPIEIPFRKKAELTVENFLSEIQRVLQSYEQFTLDSGLVIDVIHVKMPKGSGRKKRGDADLPSYLKNKKCIIQITNKDDLCAARAIVTAIARVEGHEKWENIRKGREPQGRLARELHEKAGIPFGKCSIEDIKKFQDVLPPYQINVWSGKELIYFGPEADKKIHLYHSTEHYDVITSIPALLCKKNYCNKCQKGYDHAEKHKCFNPCYHCKKLHDDEGEWMLCIDCNRNFKGETCYSLHKKSTVGGNSTCSQFYRCTCGQQVNKSLHKKKNKHRCGNVYCKTCKDYFMPGHQCYMKSERAPVMEVEDLEEALCEDKTKEDENVQKFIFFDFETTQEDLIQCEYGFVRDESTGVCRNCCKKRCGSYEHHPNLCIAQRVCLMCLNQPVAEDTGCNNCGKHEHIFAGTNTRDDFCKWLFTQENKGAIAIAHNFRGFDSWPILSFLHENNIKPEIIPNGAKNMCIEVTEWGIKMIDSLNFMPAALSKLPKMFGLTELAKGYFPHLFNKRENENVTLPHHPDIKFYNPDAMKPEDREQFLRWYDENKDKPFEFQQEILKYCRSDVDILRRCCLAFRDLFLRISCSDDQEGADPFQSCITIASACHKVFRRLFLQDGTIGLVPLQIQSQSVKAIKWIKYMAEKLKVNIQHAKNGGEKRVGEYRLDGYYETENGEKIALEFHGDFWHGCPKHYARDTRNPVSGMTMGELYEQTLDKERYLKSHGYTVISKWECEFDEEVMENPESLFTKEIDIVPGLQPRDAFFGGRTESFTLFKEVGPGESIKYYDVTSLYPYINKTGKYPVGHPRKITERFGDVMQYEGLIKCKILAPHGLLIPVLPCKINKKLLFALCKACAEGQQQEPCCHSEGQRSFTGTWVTDEVKKALEKGYVIQKIYEIWHYDHVEQYDPKTKTGGLFTGYVNKFLKIKQQASGWPVWCVDDQSKQSYIDDYDHIEGIKLDAREIQKNSGMRSLAKLMLNSFWGKFGQRSNLQQVDYITEPAEFYSMLTSDTQEVTYINFVNEETVEMRWKYVEDFAETSDKTNVIIAAYTTAQARLKLYTYLEQLDDRLLYCDTDSIVFVSRAGEPEPSLGDYLGDLTNEVENGYIDCFVTGGPKHYAFRAVTDSGIETICKVKGITLNFKNALKINFETVKDMVTSECKTVISVEDDNKIVRERNTCKLLTTKQTKTHKMVFDKRVIVNNYQTLPYGF